MDALTLNDLIKRKKKETKKKGFPIFPDVKGSVEMFNHVSDSAGPIPGTGISMGEELEFLTEEDIRQRYIDNGLDPDIDRTPGIRSDGTYYDEKGFHWTDEGNLIPEVTRDGVNLVPKEWEEWWT